METKLIQPVYALSGERVGEITLAEVFSRPLDKNFLSQVIVSFQKNARRPLAHTKGRGEVRGGGKKPWRQKGTGRARHGSIRSPIWKGGGVARGPTKDKVLKVKINKKARQGALAMALAEKVRSGEVHIVKNFADFPAKTKEFISLISRILKGAIPRRLLIITAKANKALERGGRNITGVAVKTASTVNILDILMAHRVILAQDALEILTKRLR